jgi:hypothetical protein
MSTAKQDLIQLLDFLEEDDIEQILGLVKVLKEQPEKLSKDELRELDLGEEEIRRGDSVLWEDVKRADV